MKLDKITRFLTLSLIALSVVAGANAQDTTRPYRQSPDRPYRVADTQLRTLVARIENQTDRFKRQMDRNLDRGRLDNTANEDNIMTLITEFENATDRLRDSIGSRTPYNNEANEVLLRATYIDQLIARSNVNAATRNNWSSIRGDLNTLAGYYSIGTWNWGQRLPAYGSYPTNPGFPTTRPGFPRANDRITGTYRLNRGMSDNVSAVVSRSINVYNTNERPNFERNLERRLASPEMIVIDRSGREVMIASSNAPQVTFTADNIARRETNDRGRSVTTTVRTVGQNVEINYEGDRNNDFNVSFMPMGNDQLRVTRRIYLPNRNQTVTVSSVYDRIDQIARWDAVNTGGNIPGGIDTGSNFVIPNGTRITAVLRNPLNTQATQINDRFTMEVTSPGVYRGALIEGNVSNITRSGRVSGRANVSLDFDRIRMPDGRTYRFEGIVDAVRTSNGETVSVNNEGVIRDNNQTTKTATRAGIGAALGAIIGAIAGGGEGAAVGAAVGAGAGAGSVLIQGRDNLELGNGSEFTITSMAPSGVTY